MLKKILYVEDNPDLLALMRQLIETSLPGTAVVTVSSAYGAEGALNSDCFDLVICDVKLPGELGTTVVEKILERDRDQPVMLMTAYHGDVIKEEVSRIEQRFCRQVPVSYKFSDRAPMEFIAEVERILESEFCTDEHRRKFHQANSRRRLRLTSETVREARAALAA